MAAGSIDTLRLTNGRVRELTRRIQSGARGPRARHEDFVSLLDEVTRAAVWLARVPTEDSDAEWAKEVSDYRSTLEQLRQVLPEIQSRLLAERIRLEANHKHLSAATAWAHASKSTIKPRR